MMKRRHNFTMIELITAMSVLLIFMLALMRVFTASQNIVEGASDKIDQFERARIVMDLIANDLQNMYYQEASDCPGFALAEGSNGCSITTLRSETLGTTGNPVTDVKYSFDSTEKCIKIASCGEGETGWTLNAAAIPSLNEIELIDGVADFVITPFLVGVEDDGDGKITSKWAPWESSSGGIPNAVQIELTLYGTQAIKMAESEAIDGWDNVPGNILNSNVRKFVRVVDIKRERN